MFLPDPECIPKYCKKIGSYLIRGIQVLDHTFGRSLKRPFPLKESTNKRKRAFLGKHIIPQTHETGKNKPSSTKMGRHKYSNRNRWIYGTASLLL